MNNYSLGNNNFYEKSKLDKLLKAILNDVSYGYSSIEENESLKNTLSKFLSLHLKSKILPNQILLTTSSQESINILTRALTAKNKNVLCENPTYFGLIKNFKENQLKFQTINVNENGLDTKKLKQCLQKSKYSFLYSIPSFNNPTGICYSEDNKKEIIDIAKQHNLIIIEDNPCLIYDVYNSQPSTLYANYNNTIYIGSFSKIICPALSIGYVICRNKNVLNLLKNYKENINLSVSPINIKFVENYLLLPDFDKEIKKRNSILLKNFEFIKEYFSKKYGNKCSFYNYKGGLFTSIKFNDKKVRDEVLNTKFFTNNTAYYFDLERGENEVRINLSKIDKEDFK